MSALPPHVSPDQATRLRESAAPGPRGGPERLRWLIRRIADDDHAAFSELYYRCSGLVAYGLRSQVTDRRRAAGVLAGTFVEVWWLAGCHVDEDTDVMVWIEGIVQRRVADSRPAAEPGPGVPSPHWARGVEMELAALLCS